MTDSPRAGRIFHRVLLVVACLMLLAGLFWLFGGPLLPEPYGEFIARAWPILVLMYSPLGLPEEPTTAGTYGAVFAFLGLLLLMAWLFLRQRGDWRVALAGSGRPMKSAIAAAAFMAALLTIGLIATLWDLQDALPWHEFVDTEAAGGRALFLVMIGVWLFWAIVFGIYWRAGDYFGRLGCMVQGLIVGSFLELIIATGVYAWNPQNEDCWCARGAYTGLVFGATVMIWAFGPGLVLLFLKRQRERVAAG
jgi:hypothetical protein